MHLGQHSSMHLSISLILSTDMPEEKKWIKRKRNITHSKKGVTCLEIQPKHIGLSYALLKWNIEHHNTANVGCLQQYVIARRCIKRQYNLYINKKLICRRICSKNNYRFHGWKVDILTFCLNLFNYKHICI